MDGARVAPGKLAGHADPAGARLSGCGGAGRDGGDGSRQWPPLVFAGEARRLQARAGRGRRGPGLRAAGRRLRRELRRLHRQHHPRHLPRAAADGGGADLRRRPAGGEARPHGGAVRQAALLRHRDAATASTLPSYRGDIVNGPDFTARGAHPGPGADGVRLHAVGRHAEPAARLRHRRLCRPAPGPPLEPRLRRRAARWPRATRTWRTGSTRRSASWRPAACPTCRRCGRRSSTPATRRCCCPTSRR